MGFLKGVGCMGYSLSTEGPCVVHQGWDQDHKALNLGERERDIYFKSDTYMCA